MTKHNCYECKERKVGCHGSCETYKAFLAEKETEKEMKQRSKGVSEYDVYAMEKVKRENESRVRRGMKTTGRYNADR